MLYLPFYHSLFTLHTYVYTIMYNTKPPGGTQVQFGQRRAAETLKEDRHFSKFRPNNGPIIIPKWHNFRQKMDLYLYQFFTKIAQIYQSWLRKWGHNYTTVKKQWKHCYTRQADFATLFRGTYPYRQLYAPPEPNHTITSTI